MTKGRGGNEEKRDQGYGVEYRQMANEAASAEIGRVMDYDFEAIYLLLNNVCVFVSHIVLFD